MKHEINRDDVNDLRQLLARQQLILAAAVIGVVFLAFALMRNQTTTILEPPTRVSTLTFKGNHVDDNYMAEMGQYVAHMMLDVTPSTIAERNEEVLKWVHPATYGELQNRMTVAASRLKQSNATTMFWPSQVTPDPDHLRVALMGTLQTYVNGVLVPPDQTQVWMLQLETKGGRDLIKDWKQMPLEDPLGLKAMTGQAVNAGTTNGK